MRLLGVNEKISGLGCLLKRKQALRKLWKSSGIQHEKGQLAGSVTPSSKGLGEVLKGWGSKTKSDVTPENSPALL
jgi:hypothetical protein